ncbi:hypothetical protein LCGC14_1918950, partial [marine sediment metagenome]
RFVLLAVFFFSFRVKLQFFSF